MKVIKRTHNQQEAKIIVGFLQANGVDAELLDGAINSMLPMPGGVRIAVPDDQEPKAVALLRDAENGETGLSEDPQ
ncbi:MAG: DUF2007 domain-containing protein [Alphaproteobacteria bacterium]|nr:DUF2007 domain-containing protein [Alphaproteobacteria bacterium]